MMQNRIFAGKKFYISYRHIEISWGWRNNTVHMHFLGVHLKFRYFFTFFPRFLPLVQKHFRFRVIYYLPFQSSPREEHYTRGYFSPGIVKWSVVSDNELLSRNTAWKTCHLCTNGMGNCPRYWVLVLISKHFHLIFRTKKFNNFSQNEIWN